MKLALAVLPLFATAATDGDHAQQVQDTGSATSQMAPIDRQGTWTMPDAGQIDDERCRIVVEQVRERSGMPLLQRETASDERPLLTAAIDRRIDGCPVMQMLADPDDLRPFPERSDKLRLQPIPAAE